MSDLSQIKCQVDVIVNDCLTGSQSFAGFQFLEVIEARDKYLAPNGVVIPEEYIIYIKGLTDEKLGKKLSAFRWTFSYSLNLDFLCNVVSLFEIHFIFFLTLLKAKFLYRLPEK